MASGSSGHGNSGTKGFDFASADILCSYEDYADQDSSNGNPSDPAISTNSSKDFHKTRMARTSMFPTTAYNPTEDSFNQDVIATVEKNMKNYADNLMRFLEGLSSRLSQLELYCYNLDTSIGEMRLDLIRDHVAADTKLKFLEKHLQEVHRSVQILGDKQELADTQKELAKLQLAQKESSSPSYSQSNEERSLPVANRNTDNASDTHNQQLPLALPQQVAPQQQLVAPPSQAPVANVNQPTQQPPYYIPPASTPNLPLMTQLPQNQYLPSDPQYQTPQLQDILRVPTQPMPSPVTQTPLVQQYPRYQQQQQWPQQLQPQQPPLTQPQIKAPSANVYPSYSPTNLPPTATLPNSMAMQVSYSGAPPPRSSPAGTIPFRYGGTGGTVPHQPLPQQLKGSFPAQPGDQYGNLATQHALPPTSGYMMYGSDGGRTHPP